MSDTDFIFTIKEGSFKIDDLISILDGMDDVIAEELEQLGINTGNYLKKWMAKAKKRKGKREDNTMGLAEAIAQNIEIHRLGEEISVTLGDLNYLNISHKYWSVLNEGGMIPPRTMGFFGNRQMPGGGSRNQIFHYNPKGKNKDGTKYGRGTSFLLYPKKPARPLRYINAVRRYVIKESNKLANKIIKRLQ